jgi:hypothetical protein
MAHSPPPKPVTAIATPGINLPPDFLKLLMHGLCTTVQLMAFSYIIPPLSTVDLRKPKQVLAAISPDFSELLQSVRDFPSTLKGDASDE